MPYLTSETFKQYSNTEINTDRFDEYAKKADVVLDNVTNRFYVFNDIDADPVKVRKEAFLNAVAAQIESFDKHQSTNFSDIASIPQSFTVGSTTITNSDSRKREEIGNSTSIVADDVYLFLEGTGLLYRGGAS